MYLSWPSMAPAALLITLALDVSDAIPARLISDACCKEHTQRQQREVRMKVAGLLCSFHLQLPEAIAAM